VLPLLVMPLVNCNHCNETFNKKTTEIRLSKLHYCSRNCWSENNKILKSRNNVLCDQCGKVFYKAPSEQKKTNHNYCSHSCAATYNNTHKTHGTRVSKLEIFLQEELPKKYSYEFHFNRKDAINSELDVYIPELKLAFELNGIFHYEPIYGPDKLNQIQNNDNRKFQACLEQGIELCIIDTSWIRSNKASNFQKIYDIVDNIINLNENVQN
jgi:very-short-patch-repair endonuclease